MNIGNIFSSAFNDSFRNRSLWITGLVCALIQLLTIVLATGAYLAVIALAFGINPTSLDSGDDPSAAQAGAIAFSVLFMYVAIYFTVAAAQAALIDAVHQQDTEGTINIARALRTGLLRGAPMFVTAFIAFLPMIALLVVFAGALFAAGTAGTLSEDQMSGFAGVLTLAIMCVALPLALPALGILVFAERDLVINNHGPITALGVGWRKLRAHILDAFLFGVVFYFLQLFLNLIASIVIYAGIFGGVFALAIGQGTTSSSAASSQSLAIGLAILCGSVALTVIGVVIAAWYNNLYALIWTRAFLQSESKTHQPTVAPPV
jgi:hypothetical protein